MEGGDSGKVWGIEPMVHRDSVRTLWMGSMEDNQSFMELLWKKICCSKLEMATRSSFGEMDGSIKFL